MTANQAMDIRSTLVAMFEAIDKQENIAEHLLKLDDMQRNLDHSAPAQLRHFLKRRSYTKALEYLAAVYNCDGSMTPRLD